MTIPLSLIRMLASAMVAGALSSCDRTNPGMIEKIALLEAELRERDRQLATMAEEAKSVTGTTPTDGAPDLNAARIGYLPFVESFRGKLAAAMPNTEFERTSVFPVEGPDPSRPIVSRVAFRIGSKGGRSAEMVVPLFADPAGAWQDPETDDIIAHFKSRLATQAVATAIPPPAPQPATPQRPQPTDVMGANRTVEVQWGDKPQSPPSQPAPQSPAQPQNPAMPKKVMPSSRDVIIDFE